jgi:eukaryotic-like serine/threonine-protein kinase
LHRSPIFSVDPGDRSSAHRFAVTPVHHDQPTGAKNTGRAAPGTSPKSAKLELRNRALFYSQAGRIAEARADLERALTLTPDDSAINSDLAWLLANDRKAGDRDPKRTVRLATRAVERSPKVGAYWNTLGVVRYRAGEWKAAIEALTKSMDLLHGQQESFNTFFLAMAHWQLGDKSQALTWFAKAVSWMEKNQPKDEELVRFRSEAAALLGIKAK